MPDYNIGSGGSTAQSLAVMRSCEDKIGRKGTGNNWDKSDRFLSSRERGYLSRVVGHNGFVLALWLDLFLPHLLLLYPAYIGR